MKSKLDAKIGDELYVKRPWRREVPTPAIVQSIDKDNISQSGVMYTVLSKDGTPITLDAAWFEDEP